MDSTCGLCGSIVRLSAAHRIRSCGCFTCSNCGVEAADTLCPSCSSLSFSVHIPAGSTVFDLATQFSRRAKTREAERERVAREKLAKEKVGKDKDTHHHSLPHPQHGAGASAQPHGSSVPAAFASPADDLGSSVDERVRVTSDLLLALSTLLNVETMFLQLQFIESPGKAAPDTLSLTLIQCLAQIKRASLALGGRASPGPGAAGTHGAGSGGGASLLPLPSSSPDSPSRALPLLSPSTSPGPSAPSSSFLLPVLQQAKLWAMVRDDCISMYRALHDQRPRSELLTMFETFDLRYRDIFRHPYFASLGAGFERELALLGHLVRCDQRAVEMDFRGAVFSLFQARAVFEQWQGMLAQAVMSRVQSQQAAASSPPTVGYEGLVQRSNTLIYLASFLNHEAAKVSLYFFTALASREKDMRALMHRTDPDLLGAVSTFVEKTEAASVLMLYETQGEEYHEGYVVPAGAPETPYGIRAFPYIFSYPPERENPTRLSRATLVHPTIVSLLSLERLPPERVSCHPDGSERTFFLARVDERVILAVVYAAKKKHTDKATLDFCSYMARVLSGKSLAAQLGLLANKKRSVGESAKAIF